MKTGSLYAANPIPERHEVRVIDVSRVAVPRHVVRVVEALETEPGHRPVELGELGRLVGDAFVDVREAGEPVGMLALREGVVVVHRAVSAARLQDAMVDRGIDHLRDHELGRADHLLHADGHVLHVVVLALPREGELPVLTDAEAHLGQSRPGVVARAEQHRRPDLRAVARPIRPGGRTGHDLLQVLQVYRARRVSARPLPVLEDMGVAVDDHELLRAAAVRMEAGSGPPP